MRGVEGEIEQTISALTSLSRRPGTLDTVQSSVSRAESIPYPISCQMMLRRKLSGVFELWLILSFVNEIAMYFLAEPFSY